MTSAMIWILVAVVVYLLGMLAIGFKYANNSTSEDFYLGGRKLGPIVTAMSTEASDMSAYLLMGVPGLAFFCGVAEAGWTAIGLALGTYLNWLIVAKRLRRYSAGINAITVPDFLARRFRDNTFFKRDKFLFFVCQCVLDFHKIFLLSVFYVVFTFLYMGIAEIAVTAETIQTRIFGTGDIAPEIAVILLSVIETTSMIT